MADQWLLTVVLLQSAGVMEWVVPALSAMFGAAVTAGVVYGAARGDLKSHERRLTELEDKKLEEKFVTRREFEQVMEFWKRDMADIKETQDEIRQTVTTIRDHLLASRKEALDPDRLP